MRISCPTFRTNVSCLNHRHNFDQYDTHNPCQKSAVSSDPYKQNPPLIRS
jgi:hypothetical protein